MDENDTTAPAPLAYITRVDGVALPPGYSHAVCAKRSVLVAISGQIALDEHGAFVGEGDFPAQVERAFVNLVAVLEAAGCKTSDVLKLTHFVVGLDPARLAAMRAVRERFFPGDKPASSLVGVASLVSPQALYEVEALAAREE